MSAMGGWGEGEGNRKIIEEQDKIYRVTAENLKNKRSIWDRKDWVWVEREVAREFKEQDRKLMQINKISEKLKKRIILDRKEEKREGVDRLEGQGNKTEYKENINI